MYLLDTNICIFAINKKTPQLINTINKKSKHDIYISSLTIAELEFGVENSQYVEKNRVALLKFISLFRILPFDDEDAVCYGKLKTKLKKKGEIIGPIDMLLAAQALSKDLIFVTNTADESSRVDGLKLRTGRKSFLQVCKFILTNYCSSWFRQSIDYSGSLPTPSFRQCHWAGIQVAFKLFCVRFALPSGLHRYETQRRLRLQRVSSLPV